MAYVNDQREDVSLYSRAAELAAEAPSDARLAFIRRTYLHLTAAVLAFVALEAVLLLATPLPRLMLQFMQNGRLAWLVILGAFIGVSWIANSWAMSGGSQGRQYAGLSLYVVAEAVIFLPLLAIALAVNPMAIAYAGGTTVVLFAGLTASVFLTRHDFSWMGPMLAIGGLAALVFIVVGAFTGFGDAVWLGFTCVMIFMACAYILYYTSNVIHHYRTDQHVAAALALFAAVALLFWYLLQLFLSRR